MEDYYQILGVNSDSSQEEIKRAYRSAAMKHHPDRGGNQDLFKKINNAYETLGDPNKRAKYDMMKNSGSQFRFTSSDFNFEDVFMNFNPFDAMFRRVKRNKDLNIHCQITLLDSYQGKQIEANFKLPSGKDQNVVIDIPAGIAHGATIRYQNLGDDSIPNVPRGNLNVTIMILPNNDFHRENDDLITTIEINPIEAMIGCVKEIKQINGKIKLVTINPGAETDTEYAIANEGFINLHTHQKGKFIGRIKIKTPKHIDKTLIEKLKQLNIELIRTGG